MTRRVVVAAFLGLAVACGDDGSPTAPTTTTVSISAGETVFIGSEVQFQL